MALTSKQAAAFLGISVKTLRNYAARGKIACFYAEDGTLRFGREVLEWHLKELRPPGRPKSAS